MSDWKLPWSASCLCGQVKMRVSKPPLVSAACHCDGCQKLTGGAYSLTMILSPDAFEKLEGETEIGALHRPDVQHHYCAHCKSWLYTMGERLGPNVNFRPSMLDDASWVRPYIETWASAKLPGVETGAVMSFDQFPPPEQFGQIVRAHLREGARPA